MLNVSCLVLTALLVACQVGELPKPGERLMTVTASDTTRALVPGAREWNVYQTSGGNRIVAVDDHGATVAELETIAERSGASTTRVLSPEVAEQHVGPDGVTSTFPQAPRAAAVLDAMNTDIASANSDDAAYYSCWQAVLDLWVGCQSSGGWTLDIGSCCCSTLWYNYECYGEWFDSCNECYLW
jgi:hypothetical protein